MNRKHYNAIRALIVREAKHVKRGAIWTEIVDVTGIGARRGHNYEFTEDDIERLRQHCVRTLGLDPYVDGQQADRLSQVELTADEKLARGSVFGQSLLLATTGNATLPLASGDFKLPPFAFLGVTQDVIRTDELADRNLVVIENGSLMTQPHRITLPYPWNDAVLVYRGHGDDAKLANALARAQPADRLALFFDFDPAGIEMALTFGRGSIILPKTWQNLSESTTINKRVSFYEQHKQLLRALRLAKSPELTSILGHVQQEKLAITQEALVVHQVELTALANQPIA
ncbi:hypothetical protein [Marinobacter sp. X15-166B]|uniref:DUF7281 domain-containing protein n=1 Tax=Marinobacter sp. X15-166B TaxID=1897620 RepID=UPI00085BE6B4|nr:hypothetical protein [Marinobacter sp. X15-166B]OEY67555.1 hypothetical protein BG841_14690 [Marinobacter sp. X15-166B]